MLSSLILAIELESWSLLKRVNKTVRLRMVTGLRCESFYDMYFFPLVIFRFSVKARESG